ncbi:MAG: hypothetical protein A7315_06920 [Candidatus Altiarchaeales archaeon WOR_SM1_79]|nr:MAG: hypothetical protein A7315_06920 [Candidatus Altiarchaeales archaeon WOR_SM1_79]
MEHKLIRRILKGVGEKKIITALTLMKNSKMSDAELMKVLNLGTSNSAAYYRKELEKEEIIKGYRAEIDWKKLGYPVRFTIIVEGESPELLLEMEEKQNLAIKEYNEVVGDVYVISTKSGGIILEDMSFYFGNRAIAIIKGCATSEHDVVLYSKYRLFDVYPEIKTTIAILKDNVIKNFIINKENLDILVPEYKPEKKDRIEESKLKPKEETEHERLLRNLEEFFS